MPSSRHRVTGRCKKSRSDETFGLKLLYGLGLGYVWAIFTIAFGLGAITRHLPFYNIPAFLLFLSAGTLHVVARRRPLDLVSKDQHDLRTSNSIPIFGLMESRQ